MSTVSYGVVKTNARDDWPMGEPVHETCTYQYGRAYAKKRFSFGEIERADLDGKRCALCNDDWNLLPHRLAPLGTPAGCGCLNCGPKPLVAPVSMVISVGFGAAYVSRDGEIVLDGESAYHNGNSVTVQEAEDMAIRDPDHDWRIVLDGPMGGVVYQRHDDGWVACIKLPGFA